MKSALPWIVIVVLLGGVYFLYSQNKEKDGVITKMTQDALELDSLRAENEKLKQAPAASEELTRLQKDNEDLLRLRNEAQRLRDQNKLLGAQLATAQAQNSQEQQAQQRLASENQSLRTETEKLAQTQAQVQAQQQTSACINNLRMIDAAKQQWALENKKTAEAVPTAADLAPYLPKFQPNDVNVVIACPAGGTYSINALNVAPTCTVPGHALK